LDLLDDFVHGVLEQRVLVNSMIEAVLRDDRRNQIAIQNAPYVVQRHHVQRVDHAYHQGVTVQPDRQRLVAADSLLGKYHEHVVGDGERLDVDEFEAQLLSNGFRNDVLGRPTHPYQHFAQAFVGCELEL
jgi:hypothetical protein